MGSVCSGGLPGIPSIPEIDIDVEEVASLIEEAIKGVGENVENNLREFPTEIQNAAPHPFDVPDTTIQLTTNSRNEDITLAAIISAFATQARDTIKDMIWGQIEPNVDEQLDQVEGIPQKFKDKAKDIAKEKTVDVAVDKALDAALEKIKESKNAGSAPKQPQNIALVPSQMNEGKTYVYIHDQSAHMQHMQPMQPMQPMQQMQQMQQNRQVKQIKPSVQSLEYRYPLNLNDANVRLTMWSIIYIIVTIGQIRAINDVISTYDGVDEFQDAISNATKIVIGDSCWVVAMILILVRIHILTTVEWMNYVNVAILFFGSGAHVLAFIDAMSLFCVDTINDTFDTNYCRQSYIGLEFFAICFSLYLCSDVAKNTGNNIKVRISVKAVFIGIQSFIITSSALEIDENIIGFSFAAIGFVTIFYTIYQLLDTIMKRLTGNNMANQDEKQTTKHENINKLRMAFILALIILTGLTLGYWSIVSIQSSTGIHAIYSALYFYPGIALLAYDLYYD